MADVTFTVESGYIGSPVASVNGKTGTVVLDADDVGAVEAEEGKGLSTNDYTNTDKAKVGVIVTSGDGNSYLANDGTYKTSSTTELFTAMYGTTLFADITTAINNGKIVQLNKDGLMLYLEGWSASLIVFTVVTNGYYKVTVSSADAWTFETTMFLTNQSLSAYRTSSAQDVIDNGKQAVKSEVTLTDNTTVTLADNTEYRGTNITTLTIAYPSGNFDCWLRFTTASSGTITITLPSSTYIGEAPDLSQTGKTFELSIKDGVVCGAEVGDGT